MADHALDGWFAIGDAGAYAGWPAMAAGWMAGLDAGYNALNSPTGKKIINILTIEKDAYLDTKHPNINPKSLKTLEKRC